MGRWTSTRSLKVCKPVADIAGSTPEAIAQMVRRRIHSSSIHKCYLVAVADGRVYATPNDGLAAQGIPDEQIVGTYTRTIQVCDLADDIRDFLTTPANDEAAA